VTADNDQLVKYLQRCGGYALTGLISEHALFFLYGKGQNGKSQFLLALAGAMGDYYRAAPIETFTESKTDRHPTELAWLMGVRLVIAIEPEARRRWNETRITQLTGGDPISARFMRQDFFQYMPQFKLFFSGNHKPGLRSVNKAISRRVNILPFTVTIPDKDIVLDLAQKLVTEEGAGILAWMITGCLDWQKNGLAPPPAVTQATEEYLAEENVLQTWFDECCLRKPQETTKSSDLYANWKRWAEARNEFVGSNKDFTQRMKDLGFEFKPMRDGNHWLGIALAM
jgi:putative DNA primase/helicase